MNLVPRILGFGQFAGDQGSAACRIHLLGVPKRLLRREDENLLEHFDYVVVGMIVVIEEDNLVKRPVPFLPGILSSDVNSRRCNRLAQQYSVSHSLPDLPEGLAPRGTAIGRTDKSGSARPR